ncbi:MAG: toprim domain-containing protein [Pseudomonadota bacterium]
MKRISAHSLKADPTITPEHQKELFLVEGKSAASTLNQVRNRAQQEIFALQGKLLNVRHASLETIEANALCVQLIERLGCGIAEQCQPEKLRADRVVLLTDPDVDGAHARALLAIFFGKVLRPLVESGKVLAVIPPGWRGVSGSDSQYFWTQDELDAYRVRNRAASVMRFRGVAQFSQAECHTLLLDPSTRRQVRLSL